MKFLRSIFGEFTALLILISLLIAIPPLVRIVDPTAGSVDLGGVLQLTALGAVRVFLILALLWLVWKISFPTLHKYIETEGFARDFDKLSPAQRCAAFLGTLALLILIITWSVLSL